ncbi:DUF4347 domain-containing protein [Spirulina subsalsa]|uniref:DUF4347 domain-containing protein n=1 Tax=Spirulina subsalsa TaxID=54311 RepID=UPI0002F09DE6|nr:DUF4347 domain-containing protein [Spirulina subsalsa]
MKTIECINQNRPTNLVPLNDHQHDHQLPNGSLGQDMLVVIDPGVADSSRLVSGVWGGASVLVLDLTQDAIAQIRDYLQQNPRIHSLHLITHGAPGRLYLGNTLITSENLVDYRSQLQEWRGFCSEILLYGCQIARDAQGRAFVKELSEIVGCAIAASFDLTGNTQLQGTWNLGYHTGAITSPLALTPETQATYPGVLISTVSQLIAAIEAANNTPGTVDTLNLAPNTTFNFTTPYPNPQVPFINYGATALPVITSPIIINGNGSTLQRDPGSEELFRIFLVGGPGSLLTNNIGDLTLNNLTVRGGVVPNDGGGIHNVGGNITLNGVTVTNNTAGDDGGGLTNVGTGNRQAVAVINNSTITNNTATASPIAGSVDITDGGGGIDNDGNKENGALGAVMTITNSTITGNVSGAGSGGGIRNVNGGQLTIDGNTVIANNTAARGAGIANVTEGRAPDDSGTTVILGPDVEISGNTNSTTGQPSNVETTPNAITIEPTNNPIIRLTQEGVTGAISDGGTANLGIFPVGRPAQATTFTIANTGEQDLTFSNFITNNAQLTLTPPAQTTLAPGQTTTFTITPNTNTVGSGTIDLQFNSNASNISDDGVFNLNVARTVNRGLVVSQLDATGQVVQTIADGTTTPPIDLGTVLINGTPQPTTFRIENTSGQTQTLGNPTLSNVTGISLDGAGFQNNLAAGAATTFRVSLNTAVEGTFNSEVRFTTDTDPTISQPFNFAVRGVVQQPPQIVVSQLDANNNVLRQITDGTTLPIDLGLFPVGTPSATTTFRIENRGQGNLLLGDLVATNPAFVLDTASYNRTIAPNSSTTFGVSVNTATPNVFDGAIQFTTNDPTVSGPFDFAVRSTVQAVDPGPQPPQPPQPPVPPGPQPPQPPTPILGTLSFNATGRFFAFGERAGNGLSVSLTGGNINGFAAVGITRFNATGQVTGSTPLFSFLPQAFYPNGFMVNKQGFLLGGLEAGERFAFNIQFEDGRTIAFDSPQLQVRETSPNRFALTVTDSAGVVRNLGLTVEQLNVPPVARLGLGQNLQRDGLELIDLRNVSGPVTANFTVFREAAFNNTVTLYRIDNEQGAVNGLLPGQAGYVQAVLQNRVGVDLRIENEGIGRTNAVLGGGALYAPVIFVNSTPDNFLSLNPDNAVGLDAQAYFIYGAANSDGVDHIKLLGGNVFGFEDLPFGGDRDFNDLIVRAELSLA